MTDDDHEPNPVATLEHVDRLAQALAQARDDAAQLGLDPGGVTRTGFRADPADVPLAKFMRRLDVNIQVLRRLEAGARREGERQERELVAILDWFDVTGPQRDLMLAQPWRALLCARTARYQWPAASRAGDTDPAALLARLFDAAVPASEPSSPGRAAGW